MKKILISHPVRDLDDVRVFFDRLANEYRESHGPADRLLQDRLGIIRRLLPQGAGGNLLEIGCGPGTHLLALADRVDRGLGIDLSPAMIERAEWLRREHPLGARLSFAVDQAERLSRVADGAVDAVLCVGAFEHMLPKAEVLLQINRVLKPGGAFVCLTPNGGFLWYVRLARWLNLETRHLSTDRFLDEQEVRSLIARSGLAMGPIGYWTFIPRGDMPWPAAWLLRVLDGFGRVFGCRSLRGGLYFQALKPSAQTCGGVSSEIHLCPGARAVERGAANAREPRRNTRNP